MIFTVFFLYLFSIHSQIWPNSNKLYEGGLVLKTWIEEFRVNSTGYV